MLEPTQPDIQKTPSISARRLYHLLTQFHTYHDVYYKTKEEELAAATRVAQRTATEEDTEKYRKFEKNKFRANWFTAVIGFACMILEDISLVLQSEKYENFSKRIGALKALIDTRRGTGILSGESEKEGEIKYKIQDSDIEFAENLIRDLLCEYFHTANMSDVDSFMEQYHVT